MLLLVSQLFHVGRLAGFQTSQGNVGGLAAHEHSPPAHTLMEAVRCGGKNVKALVHSNDKFRVNQKKAVMPSLQSWQCRKR